MMMCRQMIQRFVTDVPGMANGIPLYGSIQGDTTTYMPEEVWLQFVT